MHCRKHLFNSNFAGKFMPIVPTSLGKSQMFSLFIFKLPSDWMET
jgi:hypothetical protein